MMIVTRATDYAVRVLLYLGEPNAPEHATREEIIAATAVPGPFLNKIVQKMVRHKVLSARPGVHGGCSLACSLDDVSILKVVEMMEGPILLSECLPDVAFCPRGSYCSLRTLLGQLQHHIIRTLRGKSIGDMVREGADPKLDFSDRIGATPTLVPLPCSGSAREPGENRSKRKGDL